LRLKTAETLPMLLRSRAMNDLLPAKRFIFTRALLRNSLVVGGYNAVTYGLGKLF